MRKDRRNRGFTMAELLVVVAIIGILSGVSFIAVQAHEESMNRLERDAIAKEIFVAAQNHLTMAKAQNYNYEGVINYNDTAFFGDSITYPDTEELTCALRYEGGNGTYPNMLDIALPFGSVDETVRAGGRYLILYQPQAARVLDVFYWDSDGKYGGTAPGNAGLLELAGEDNRNDRQKSRPIIGWFGGNVTIDTGVFLNAPIVEIINAEKLYVTITDTNTKAILGSETYEKLLPQIKLLITGKASEAVVSFRLFGNNSTRLKDDNSGVYTIVLDDVTTNKMHFYDINSEIGHSEDSTFVAPTPNPGTAHKQFIPGEDIVISAVAYSNKDFTNIAYSGEWTTNSLFDALRINADTITTTTALINNIRHLENLDYKVSNVGYDINHLRDITLFDNAEQTADLNWPDFTQNIARTATQEQQSNDDSQGGTQESANSSVKIYSIDGSSTDGGFFKPVSPMKYALEYTGQSEFKEENESNGPQSSSSEYVTHSITGIRVNSSGDAGLFGELIAGSSVSNLELIDFDITSTSGNAGALVGTLTQSAADVYSVSNVIAYNTTTDADTATINATGSNAGDAGGLIGKLAGGNGKVTKSVAALIVSSTGGNAGGLIGSCAGGSVTASYSGGHTKSGTGMYDTEAGATFNVTAATNAGGLIGDAGSTTITNCYSTCSVKGATAGGFIGSGSGNITNCYATGLVNGSTTAGAFAGTLTGTLTSILDGCKYFEIINEMPNTVNGGFTYLPALGNNLTETELAAIKDKLKALDEDYTSYNEFTDAPAAWKSAVPYDAKLIDYYGEGTGDDRVSKYNLKTVVQLGATDVTEEQKDDNGNITVEGDFVSVHYGDWPAPEIFVLNQSN